eukprot:14273838-Alexandrium_andersonii.AAC.1
MHHLLVGEKAGPPLQAPPVRLRRKLSKDVGGQPALPAALGAPVVAVRRGAARQPGAPRHLAGSLPA